MKTVPPAAALTVLCAVMREPQLRPTDIVHQGCHFFDINRHKAHWAGDTIDLPCSEYTGTCYTKKLAVLLQRMLETNHDFFYYVESDHHICTPMATLETLAARYMVNTEYGLITTGIGASGWLFTRHWAQHYLEALTTCTEWCACPDCIAALLQQPRATTRVVLTQHSVANKKGLNENNKPLPRCYQKRTEFGLNRFDFFDHTNCKHADITPCTSKNWGIFTGH